MFVRCALRIRSQYLLSGLLVLLLSSGVWMSGSAAVLEEPPSSPQAAGADSTIRLVVKASPSAQYQSEATFTDKAVLHALEERTPGTAYSEPLLPDTALTFRQKGQEQRVYVTPTGQVVDPVGHHFNVLDSEAQNTLKMQVQSLRQKHYGELLPWKDANRIIPKFSSFTIVDVESGLSFEGQRRAGSSHADVQPLTKEDSATLKSIYGGSWSWNRRAVLIKYEGRTLAASMHGMPHGGDGIPGNDFNGHFCIHFLGSVTHRSRSMDPAHQVMVHRAAGLLNDYVSKLPPLALIDVWISAAHQGDLQLLQAATGEEQAVHVRSMRRLSKAKEPDVSRLLQYDTDVDVSTTPEGASAVKHRRIHFHLERASLEERWYIRSAEMR
ncbi:hypothetical protein ABE504_05385 [Paenibacillus oryzisoli]|uniref:hypothetical protein n=1 Tax=Paenibacillus oryzisoli TaxID=1850517 RepID=UPI003D26B824